MRFCIILHPTPYSSSSYFIPLATMNLISTMLDRVKISLPPKVEFIQVLGKKIILYIYIALQRIETHSIQATTTIILKTKVAAFKTQIPSKGQAAGGAFLTCPGDYQITNFQTFPFVSPLTAHSCGVLGDNSHRPLTAGVSLCYFTTSGKQNTFLITYVMCTSHSENDIHIFTFQKKIFP